MGVQNNLGTAVPNMHISGSSIFSFDGDGICSGQYSPTPAGCPFGSTQYEGPNTSFSIVDPSHGTVNFAGGLASGASAYFSLEGALSAASITILRATKLTYTGPMLAAQGQPVTLSGVLKADNTTPISKQTVTLSLGSQNCIGTTDTGGTAKCRINSVSAPLGNNAATANFAGGRFYPPAKDSKQVLIFAFLSSGSFILGDQTVASVLPNTTVTWWGSQWQKLNRLSSGSAPAAFKGFATTLSMTPPSCGNTWTTDPGNSSGSPTSVPSYMAVIVTSTVSKSGRTISGNTPSIVIVKTNSGYVNNPGHVGIGTVVAVLCKSPNQTPSSNNGGGPLSGNRLKKPSKKSL